MAGSAYQLDLFDKILVRIVQQIPRCLAVEPFNALVLGQHRAPTRGVTVDGVVIQVINTLELLAHTDGPVDGRALNLQHIFYLIQQFYRIADIAVHFVDEAEDGGIAQATHVHQLDGAVLHPLGAVYHHQRGIHRGQGAVGILGEILVSRGIEQVHCTPAIGELHH